MGQSHPPAKHATPISWEVPVFWFASDRCCIMRTHKDIRFSQESQTLHNLWHKLLTSATGMLGAQQPQCTNLLTAC